MGRAQRGEAADHFSAVMGSRRGVTGEGALERRAADAPQATLMTQFHSENVKERRAAAREFRDRFQGQDNAHLLATERSILWAHCISQADQVTREAIIDGLCAEMTKIFEVDGETPEVSQAIVFLAADPSDPKRRPSEREVVSTLVSILSPEFKDSMLPTGSPILEDAFSHLFDALYAVPQSESLASLMGGLAAACREKDSSPEEFRVSDGGLHEQMRQFVAMHRSPSEMRLIKPALDVWLKEGLLRPDKHDQTLLVTMAEENPKVAPGSAMEDVLEAWAEHIRGNIYDPQQAGWEALKAHADTEGDGYDVLREALGVKFIAGSVGYVGQMSAKLHQGILEARTADGDLPELAQEVLAVLCSDSTSNGYTRYTGVNGGEERRDVVLHLAALPESYRQRDDVRATVAACAEGAAESLREEASSYCSHLGILNKHGRRGNEGALAREQMEEIAAPVKDIFQHALSAGGDPYESARQVLLPQIIGLYAHGALGSEGLIKDVLGDEKYESIIPGKRVLKKGKYHKVLTVEDWQEIYHKGIEADATSHFIGAEWAVAPGEKSLYDPLIEQLIS